MRHRRIAAALVGLGVLAVCAASPATAAPAPTTAATAATTAAGSATTSAVAFHLTDIKHVFQIVLENEDYAHTFGDPSADPYLAKTLPAQGLLMPDYYSTGHESNDNYVSLISGQAPNTTNQFDCQSFVNFPSTALTPGEPDQQAGRGCVYPTSIGNLGSQLSAKGLSWKAYEQDMGNVPARETAACGHPAVGAADKTQDAVPGDGYVSRHDPFVYFHNIIDNPAYCDAHVVALGTTTGVMPKTALIGETGLAADLRSAATTPAYSFITPNLCDDGHDYPCKNQTSGTSAVADIDTFLKAWVPAIEASPAFKDGGLIDITFDESDGPQSDSSSCCHEAIDPNAVLTAGLAGLAGSGGGRIGAVLISPDITPGTTTTLQYNHYSTLATVETVFGLSRLGYAQQATPFTTSLFRVPTAAQTIAYSQTLATTQAAAAAGAATTTTSATSATKRTSSHGALAVTGLDTAAAGAAALALLGAGGAAYALRRRAHLHQH